MPYEQFGKFLRTYLSSKAHHRTEWTRDGVSFLFWFLKWGTVPPTFKPAIRDMLD